MFFIYFHRFCGDLGIVGSHSDILGIVVIWDKCAVFVFYLSLSFIFLGMFAESRFFLFLGGGGEHKKKTTNKPTTKSLVDRGGIWDFQHCVVITRGQIKGIPKTASVVRTIISLRSCLL